jgi:hypothetical protein
VVERVSVSLRGTLPGGEVWSVNLNGTDLTGSGNPSAYVDLQAFADNIASNLNVTASYGDLKAMLGSGSALTRVRVENRQAKLLVSAAEQAVTGFLGSGTIVKPLQTSLVFSMRSVQPGASRRGRAYWPFLALPALTGTGRVPTANAGNLATQFVSMLQALSDAAPGAATWRVHVYSVKLDVLTPINSVQVGDVPDTQRRRRDDLVEAYSAAVYPVP